MFKNAITIRNQKLLKYIALGYTNLEIGQKFGIKEDTVHKIIGHLCELTDCKGRVKLAVAFELGYLYKYYENQE